jgi:spore germination protein GerM
MTKAALAGAVAASLLVMAASETVAASPNGTIQVKVFLPRGDPGSRCDRVYAVPRRVSTPAVLKGAVETLLKGPTAAERRRGYGGWFSARTAHMLRGVRLAQGVAYIDFRDFRRVIPNASSSCGSALLLAQLTTTVTQFPTVRRAIYSFNGSRSTFYEWLQLSPG